MKRDALIGSAARGPSAASKRLSPAYLEVPELVKDTHSYSPGKGGQLSTASATPPKSKSGVKRHSEATKKKVSEGSSSMINQATKGG